MPRPVPNAMRRLARDKAVKAAVRAVAEEILAAAKVRAAAHSDSGRFAKSLKINRRGRTDTRVESNDPAGAHIELGHTDAKTGNHVPGIHALGGAAADVAGGGP
ncbi:DUF5403 family protein [Longispora sp. NPDC051575]|uniref:DUF5403 family protein n=1 Tax=Longispora sp. NPDC051575 TaxID=3154943 RepID=UPI0034383F80